MMIRHTNRLMMPLILSIVLTAMLSAGSNQIAYAADINPVRFVMPNGLTVLVQEQHALPIVQIHALIKAGAAHDPSDKAGLANLVAGLLDEGTTTRSANQIGEQLLKCRNIALTGRERTHLHFDTLVGQRGLH